MLRAQLEVSIPYRFYQKLFIAPTTGETVYGFNPLQVLSKALNLFIHLSSISCFNPLQVLSKVTSIKITVKSTLQFQSLIGSIKRDQTIAQQRLLTGVSIPYRFYQKDSRLQRLRQTCLVSIPYRFYQKSIFNDFLGFLSNGFNPLQVLSKASADLSNKLFFELFQSLIGSIKRKRYD